MNANQIIRKIVEERGLKISYLAQKTGIHVDAVSRSLLGKRKLSADEFLRICNTLSLSINDFEKKRPA